MGENARRGYASNFMLHQSFQFVSLIVLNENNTHAICLPRIFGVYLRLFDTILSEEQHICHTQYRVSILTTRVNTYCSRSCTTLCYLTSVVDPGDASSSARVRLADFISLLTTFVVGDDMISK